VLDRLVPDGFDVMSDPCGDEHDRPRPHLVRQVANVVPGPACHDHRDLVELVDVGTHVHPRLAFVHHEQAVLSAETASPNAGADSLVGDLIPGHRSHPDLLSVGGTCVTANPSSADRTSAASGAAGRAATGGRPASMRLFPG